MPGWKGSDRRARLPANWPELRQVVLKRDEWRCTYRKTRDGRCTAKATDVDHVVPGDDHSLSNLTSLCNWHHLRKSGSEGSQAATAKRKAVDASFRRSEVHPGFV